MKQSSCNKQWTEQHTIKTQPPKNCIKICRNTTQNAKILNPKTKRKTTKLISNSNLLSTRRHVVKAKAERGGWDSECEWEWEKSHSFDCFLEVQFIMNFMNMKFAVIYLLLCLSLFHRKRSKFSLATSSSSFSKSSIKVDANKKLPTRVAANSSREFLVGTLV